MPIAIGSINKWIDDKYNSGFSRPQISKMYDDFIRDTHSTASRVSFQRYVYFAKPSRKRVNIERDNDEKTSSVSSITDNENQNDEGQVLIKILKNGNCKTLGELSRLIDRSKETVLRIISELTKKGYEISYDVATKQVQMQLDQPRTTDRITVDDKLYSNRLKYGVISDTHIGSQYQCSSLIKLAYDIFARENVAFVLHCGDLTDGVDVYKGHKFEVWSGEADAQMDYVIENYPKAPFKTHVISGNHDLSFRKTSGFNIVRAICQQRNDLVYRGDFMASFDIEGLDFRVAIAHPARGQAYSRSYQPQKMAEAVAQGALEFARSNDQALRSDRLPDVLHLGHWHYRTSLPYFGMEVFTCAGMQQLTPYAKSKGFSSTIECAVIELYREPNENDHLGIVQIVPRHYRIGKFSIEKDY